MRALVICHRIPYPPNKGDKIRSYNLIKYLKNFYEISLFFLIDDLKDIDGVKHLESMVNSVGFDVITPFKKKAAACTTLFTGTAASVRYFYSIKLQEAIDNLLETEVFDLICCFCSPTAEYIFRSKHYDNGLNDIAWAMDLMDMDSEKWLDYAKNCKWPQALIYRMESKRLRRYEARIAQEFDRIFLVSEIEKDLFVSKIGEAKVGNVMALPNGVDLTYFDNSYKSQLKENKPTLVFTGVMDYWPNVSGVTWFAKEIFPKVREVYPNCQFFIVGKNPVPEIKALGRLPGIIVTGFVKDVRDYLSIADVSIVPLKMARGIQNKILEAMAMAKPVVTTSKALEGIQATPGKEVLVSDSAQDFARYIIDLLSNPQLASTIGQNARAKVQSSYSWKVSHAILSKALGLPLETGS